MSSVARFIRSILSTFRTTTPVGYDAYRSNMTVEQLRMRRKLKNADKLAKLKAECGMGENA